MVYKKALINDAEPPVPDDLYRKSSFSSTTGGNCVEVAFPPGECVAVRDSKNTAAVLMLGERAFAAFIASFE